MKQIKIEPPRDSGITIFLSLFLLLLAFFILLNSLATIEKTKTRKVLTSVAATFRSVVDTDTHEKILISDLGPTPEAQDVLEALQQLWVTAVPVAKVEKLTQGRVMRLTLPANDLFLGGRPVLRADREGLFNRTALLLALKSKGAVTEARVVFGTKRGAHTLGDAEGRLAGERAVRMATALVGHGAPPARLSVGLVDGNPKMVHIDFEIRDARRAQVTFKKESADGKESAE